MAYNSKRCSIKMRVTQFLKMLNIVLRLLGVKCYFQMCIIIANGNKTTFSSKFLPKTEESYCFIHEFSTRNHANAKKQILRHQDETLDDITKTTQIVSHYAIL